MPNEKNNNRAFSNMGVKIIGILLVILISGLGWIIERNFAGDAEAKKQIEKKVDKEQYRVDMQCIRDDLEKIESKQDEGFKETRKSMERMQDLIIEEIKKGK